jgi:hypothetical protein
MLLEVPMTRINHDRVLYAQAFLLERDLCLLEWLYDHHVLSTNQVAAALFPSRKSAQKRLLRLYQLGLLQRFRPPARVGSGTHHVLDRLGVEVIAALRGDATPRPSDITAQRHRVVMSPELPHLLGVNQFFIDLIAYARNHTNASLLRWWSERQCAVPLRFGSASMHRVRADGHGIFEEGQHRVGFFLEYDRGTESLPVLAEKAQRYEELIAQGGPAWPVLFFLPNSTREQRLHELLQHRQATGPIATTARSRIRADQCVADAVWLATGTPDVPRRLADLGQLGDSADDAALVRLDRRPIRS